MNKTKIDWCDSTWNPVTGCLKGCEYCYARGIARRFGGDEVPDCTNHDLRQPIKICVGGNDEVYGHDIKAPYPFYFDPTFHRYRLDEPQKLKKPSNIFVCSMADLFGEWVPDEWIAEVFKACEAAPQHRYLFLTKNPQRYCDIQELIYDLAMAQYSPEIWLGVSITGEPPNMFNNSVEPRIKSFLSIEPYIQEIRWIDLTGISWVIIGAETKNGKVVNAPKREWIENIVKQCRICGIPVFMKNSLANIWGEPLIQEYPF